MKYFVLLLTVCFTYKSEANSSINYNDRYAIYNSIDFGDNPVDQQVFNYAFKGYIELVEQNKLSNPDILSIIDYSKLSIEKRLWVFNLTERKLLFNEWVSHGKYTGTHKASKFSNTVNSKQSSLGFFITGKTYNGKHKYSLKLHGVEPFFNSNAYRRGIVIHGANYVSETFIKQHNRLGRSYGCPAIRQDIKYPLISTISNGSCLFSYYPSENYLSTSTLLN